MIINDIGCENMQENSKNIACPFGYSIVPVKTDRYDDFAHFLLYTDK